MIEGLVRAPDALQMILGDAAPSSSETVSLRQAAGRVLASDLAALRTQPPFDACAMDGYGVHQSDLSSLPATLKVVGQSAAGHPYQGKISKNEAVRIFTGAQVPSDIDTIIIQENTTTDGDDVRILETEAAGKFIRRRGLDFENGEILLEKGRLLDPQSVSLAASMNHSDLNVWKKPIVALLATGDELVLPGNVLKEGEIIASNSFALASIIENAGGKVLDMGIAKDTVESLTSVTQDAIDAGASVIVTMGGASVGDHDLVMPAMREMGFEFVFAKIAMRPGKPFLFARNNSYGNDIRLLGLAGNPVSSIIAGQVFVRPLINALAGLPPQKAQPVTAILGGDLPANDQRQEYMRAVVENNKDGNLVATAFDKQDSSMLANLTRADALIVRAVDAPAAKSGETCEIVLLK